MVDDILSRMVDGQNRSSSNVYSLGDVHCCVFLEPGSSPLGGQRAQEGDNKNIIPFPGREFASRIFQTTHSIQRRSKRYTAIILKCRYTS